METAFQELAAERLKNLFSTLFSGDFKKVAAAIKLLTNDQIEEFLKRGKVELEGHKLVTEDVRVIYQFAQENSK